MSMDLTGITNQNEYYTNHYFSSIFEENASDAISNWRAKAKDSKEIRTPWSLLKDCARQYYPIHDRYTRSRFDMQTVQNIKTLADSYLAALGYPNAKPDKVILDDTLTVPVYLEITKPNGAPLLWVILAAAPERDIAVLERFAFDADRIADAEPTAAVPADLLTTIPNEDLATKILFSMDEPPRFLIFIGMNQIALIDRNKWNEKRYLQFELEDIFSRHEETTLQAMAVLLHKDSICPEEGTPLLDELDSNSQKHAAGVSQDLKYALRESIELLGNEVIYYADNHPDELPEYQLPLDASELTIECLRYMYRMLFVLFIEARPELGYAPIKAQSYLTGYSLESLRDIADNIREDVDEVGDGYFLHDTLTKLYDLIYNGYPASEEDIQKYSEESLHDMFIIAPLKAHIFDPERTKLITHAKLRNSCMLRIIDLMSLTRSSGRKNERRGRISYANLGINQLGAVYEALLSYRGFIAETDLYEVKRAGDKFDELDVGYFVKEEELNQYEEDERVRYESGENKGKPRMYKKGSFIYRLAGREREKSASYYTPEVLTKCLVKYALKELLEGKTADEILSLSICEPAMGSAAFLNETISQLAEAYIDRKQKELGETISYEKRFTEVQKVKMYIADRNVYGIDLNPIAVELAEVSLWLNTIYEGGFVPWFGTQLVNGNSLIGARRQCYSVNSLQTSSKGLRWYENAPERVPLGTNRKMAKQAKGNRQIWHFLLGDPGMCNYTDKVIKSLEPDNIKKMKDWNKKFTSTYSDGEVETLLRLSAVIDDLWDKQVQLREKINEETQDKLSVFGHEDEVKDSHTTIRQKDRIYRELYKSENMKNAGPYARLKFAMDYWCALWFWPIDQVDLLPTRSEFFFDMSLILEGTMRSAHSDMGQMSLFPTENEMLAQEIINTYGSAVNEVDIPALRKNNPRLNLAAEIAEQNHFMHWELEFADLFKERGGFDLVIGNPPWIKIEWNEQNVISEKRPMFVIKGWKAPEIAKNRPSALMDEQIKKLYIDEYEKISGEQSFLNAMQNYLCLRGQQTDLFKCFLPQAWMFSSKEGISAFIHPEGVYDDSKGGELRKILYSRLRRHYQFINEKMIFAEVAHAKTFSLNIYGSPRSLKTNCFQSISNLFDANAIDQCYEPANGEAEGLKDEYGNWSVKGHPDRLLFYGEKELKILALLSGEDTPPDEAKLVALQTKQILSTIECFAYYPCSLHNIESSFNEMWHETYAQNDGTITRNTIFPESPISMIYSGPHISVANPLSKTPRRECKEKGDYDCIDLTIIDQNYLPRTNYSVSVTFEEYQKRNSSVYGKLYFEYPKLVSRKMLNLKQERTLNIALIPEGTGHISGLVGVVFQNPKHLLESCGTWATIPFDYYVKIMNKQNFNYAAVAGFPIIDSKYDDEIILRGMLLNCLTEYYSNIYKTATEYFPNRLLWAKRDPRLVDKNISMEWDVSTPLRSDYERREALVELDVLTSMALGMTLDQLKNIYRLQFAVAQQYEIDTWYDANGRIAFTTNRSLVGVGYSRSEWENGIKGAPAGKKFYRTITDDTMPGGPVERTIEYVAPFDRCDREQDYETAWDFFEEKYGKVTE